MLGTLVYEKTGANVTNLGGAAQGFYCPSGNSAGFVSDPKSPGAVIGLADALQLPIFGSGFGPLSSFSVIATGSIGGTGTYTFAICLAAPEPPAVTLPFPIAPVMPQLFGFGTPQPLPAQSCFVTVAVDSEQEGDFTFEMDCVVSNGAISATGKITLADSSQTSATIGYLPSAENLVGMVALLQLVKQPSPSTVSDIVLSCSTEASLQPGTSVRNLNP
jgi:hypothetical protein